jgi:hypothetical protein
VGHEQGRLCQDVDLRDEGLEPHVRGNGAELRGILVRTDCDDRLHPQLDQRLDDGGQEAGLAVHH